MIVSPVDDGLISICNALIQPTEGKKPPVKPIEVGMDLNGHQNQVQVLQ